MRSARLQALVVQPLLDPMAPILVDPVESQLPVVLQNVLLANDLLLTQGAGNVGAISLELAQQGLPWHELHNIDLEL